MLNIVVFGVACELDDGDPSVDVLAYNLAPAPATTEVSDPNAAQTSRRFRRQSGYVSLEELPPWQRRWEAYRERRRKHVHVSFTEFADLSDGRRVIIRNDRGRSWSWRHSPGPWHGDTRESLADEICDYFFQVEEDRPIEPSWVVERVQRLYDIEIDSASVQAALRLPRRVEFGTRILQQLPSDETSAGSSSQRRRWRR